MNNSLKTKIALVAIAAFALAPTSAAAQQQTERCAVGLRTDPGYGTPNIVRMYGSTNYQPNVQIDAGVCTDLIAAGWFGVSKYGEWERRNGGAYRPICGYTWPWGDSVAEYARAGSEDLAWYDCTASFSGGTFSDLTSLY